jgi:hypothetical protein
LEEEMAQLVEAPGVTGVIVPSSAPALTPEEAAKGHNTVTMVFDVPVLLTLGTNQKVHYPKGVHEVPVEHADHWYLKAHGARQYAKPISVGELAKETKGAKGKTK